MLQLTMHESSIFPIIILSTKVFSQFPKSILFFEIVFSFVYKSGVRYSRVAWISCFFGSKCASNALYDVFNGFINSEISLANLTYCFDLTRLPLRNATKAWLRDMSFISAWMVKVFMIKLLIKNFIKARIFPLAHLEPNAWEDRNSRVTIFYFQMKRCRD